MENNEVWTKEQDQQNKALVTDTKDAIYRIFHKHQSECELCEFGHVYDKNCPIQNAMSKFAETLPYDTPKKDIHSLRRKFFE